MSEFTNTKESSIRIIGFSGKKQDWVPWEEKFVAKAKRRGYKSVLLGKESIPKSSDDFTSDDSDKVNGPKIKEKNEEGYTDLILSMDTTKSAGKIAFNIVRNSKTPDYEDGNIAVAFANL